MKKLAILTALAILAGCEAKEPNPAVEQIEEADAMASEVDAADEIDSGENAAREPNLDPFAGTEIYGSPHDEEHQKFEIRFHGDEGELVTLYRNPGSNSIAGKFEPQVGGKLNVTESLTIVDESRPLIATKGGQFPATDYVPSSNTFGKERMLRFEKGDVVYLLKHGAEGTCYIGFDTQTYHAPCPSTDLFEWDGGRATDGMSWWVLVSDGGARGWLEVDGDRVRHEMVEAQK